MKSSYLERIEMFKERVSSKLDLLREDNPYSRAMLAKLRRAIGKHPHETPEIWNITLSGHIADHEYGDFAITRNELAIHTSLTLFALHMQGNEIYPHNKGVSFGKALQKLAQENSENYEAVCRRFNRAVIADNILGLAVHLRGLIRQMRDKGIGMDYAQLAVDFVDYQNPMKIRKVRHQWGRDFYGTNVDKK